MMCCKAARCCATLRSRLAEELHVPSRALRMGPPLRMPGVSVQLLELPKGLSEKTSTELMKSGISAASKMTLAFGPADVAGLPDGKIPHCEAHRFTVTLRGLNKTQLSAGLFDERLEEIRTNGFVNFFELPYFGLAEVTRFEIGAALWGGQWDTAARLLLTANRADALRPASQAFVENDYAAGIELLPATHNCKGMRKLAMNLLLKRPAKEALLAALAPQDWAKHLSSLSRLAWNKAVSVRLGGAMPLRPVPGDFVWDGKAGEPRPVTAKEVSEDRWHLSDVVLPLPLPGKPVPESGGRLLMEAVLRDFVPGEDAAAEIPLKLEQMMPRVRHIVSVPADMTWDVDEGLVDCDLQRLGFAAKPRGRAIRAQSLALQLRATLRRTESAESLLREVLKANPTDFLEGLDREDEVF